MSYLEEYKQKHGLIKYILFCIVKLFEKSIVHVYMKRQRQLGGIDENVIVFMSIPDYSDNSKALSEFLEKNGYAEKYNIYWLVEDVAKSRALYKGNKVTFLPRFDKYHEFPLRSLRICMHAHYLIWTHYGLFHKNEAIKGQISFSLWHGCGYKDNNNKRISSVRFDRCLVPGPLFVKTKAKFWRISEDFLIPAGYPRYDWLLNPSNKAKSYRNRILGDNKHLIIWMPTFRNSTKSYAEGIISQFPIIHDEKDWMLLDEECYQKGVVILLKLHTIQKKYNIKFENFKNIINIDNETLDINEINLYELLSVTDGLISDYSSVAFDYLIVNNPIAYTLDDYEVYKNTRGFVFDNPKEYMPGHHLYKMNDLIQFVDSISLERDPYMEKRNKIKQEAIHDSSHYCQDIAKLLKLSV